MLQNIHGVDHAWEVVEGQLQLQTLDLGHMGERSRSPPPPPPRVTPPPIPPTQLHGVAVLSSSVPCSEHRSWPLDFQATSPVNEGEGLEMVPWTWEQGVLGKVRVSKCVQLQVDGILRCVR